MNFVDLDDYLLAALTCQFLQQVPCFYKIFFDVGIDVDVDVDVNFVDLDLLAALTCFYV